MYFAIFLYDNIYMRERQFIIKLQSTRGVRQRAAERPRKNRKLWCRSDLSGPNTLQNTINKENLQPNKFEEVIP